MPEYDSGFKIVARSAGRRLADLARVPGEGWEPIVSEVQTAERFADRAFKSHIGREEFVVYLEAYTFWDRWAPWNMMTKAALLSEREHLPTYTVAFILRPRGYVPQRGRFRLVVDGKWTQQLRFHEVPLWRRRPQSWWDESPGLMALYPLCQHGQSARTAVTHAAGVITSSVSDTAARADLLTSLAIFGRLAYPRIDVWQLIGREQMKESPLYQEIMEEGELKNSRANILVVLEVRFGADASARFEAALEAIDDLEVLSQLLRLAAGCSRLKEFRDACEAARESP